MNYNDDITINDALTIYLGAMRFFKIADYLLQLKRFHIYSKEFWNNIEEHTHPYFELLIPLEGDVHYSVDNYPVSLDCKSQVIIIPPATPHIRTVLKAGDMVVLLQFTIEDDEKGPLSLSDMLKTQLEQNFYIHNVKSPLLVKEIIDICIQRPPLWQDYISNYLGKFFLDLLSLSIGKLQEKNSHESTYPTNAQKNFKRFELMLETSLDVRLTLGEYADKIGISKRQLERWIRQYHDMTFSQYIKKRRFNIAKKLLSDSSYTLKEVADAIGYDNVSYFCSLFKKATGVTPFEYRKQQEDNEKTLSNETL